MAAPDWLASADWALVETASGDVLAAARPGDPEDEDEPVRVSVRRDCEPCEKACPAFARVFVSRSVPLGARVAWSLREDFGDPGPYEFTLEAGGTPSNDSDDWEAVGIPVVDQFYAVDHVERDWDVVTRTHYRVRLETSRGEYLSEPTGAAGVLGHRGWRIYREAVRQRRLEYKKNGGVAGLVLKRRVTGEPCPTCLDPQTDDPTDPACPDCWGTGRRCGYYYPFGCAYVKLAPRLLSQREGTADGFRALTVVQADMLLTDRVESYDLWVDSRTDDRYEVGKVQVVAEVEGVPVAARVGLSLLPRSSPRYLVPVPQLAEDFLL